ncbi:hypothetical protein GF386_04070 [Candidatus Pacearchaeota archaeon]|nr:hypothetical protein [Candidatus Pacearchaeota archaeon]
MNKKGFLIRTWVIAFLIFSSVFALLFLASQSLAYDYGKDDIVDESYRENYDKFSETSEDYRDIFQDISDGSGLQLAFAATTGIFRALFTTVKVTFSSVSILDSMTSNIASDYGIPESISNVIFPLTSAIVVVILIFAVISAINRGNKL